jgi:hypothetical protein
VRSPGEIRLDIERASERRGEVLRLLYHGHDTALTEELKRLDAQLDRLWDEQRQARAYLRFGERDRIVARARAQERIDRAA